MGTGVGYNAYGAEGETGLLTDSNCFHVEQGIPNVSFLITLERIYWPQDAEFCLGEGTTGCTSSIMVKIKGPDGTVLAEESITANISSPPSGGDPSADWVNYPDPPYGSADHYFKYISKTVDVERWTKDGPANLYLEVTRDAIVRNGVGGYVEGPTPFIANVYPNLLTDVAVPELPGFVVSDASRKAGSERDSSGPSPCFLPDGTSILPAEITNDGNSWHASAGAAADGGSCLQVIFSSTVIAADPNASQKSYASLTFDLLDENGNAVTDTSVYGGLIPINSQRSTPQTTVSETFVKNNGRILPQVIYRAPMDFSRGTADNNKATRVVKVRVRNANVPGGEGAITIYRPPLLLVHGLWANKGSWNSATFEPLVKFSKVLNPKSKGPLGLPTLYDYGKETAVINATPDFAPNQIVMVKGSALGVEMNSKLLNVELITQAKGLRSKKIVATGFDFVGHSLGGLVVRALPQTRLVHKLITIDTPHLGSPIAVRVLQNANGCVRAALSLVGNDAVVSATPLSQGILVNGAVSDLRGDDGGNAASPILSYLAGQTTVPTAIIAATTLPANLAGLDFGKIPYGLRAKCKNSPLAQQLTSASWANVFGNNPNDSIVSLESQTNGHSLSLTLSPLAGLIHSKGSEPLGFIGPDVLGSATVANRCLELLNTKVTDSNVYKRY